MTAPFPTPLVCVGITASRNGLTDVQTMVLGHFLIAARARGAFEFHHGDCIGGDLAGAQVARYLGYRIVGHPGYSKHNPQDMRYRAHFPSDELHEPLPYLERDWKIVSQVHALIGLPSTDHAHGRSGTWYTIRAARSATLPRLVVGPSGKVIDYVDVAGLLPITPGQTHVHYATTNSRLGADHAEEPHEEPA